MIAGLILSIPLTALAHESVQFGEYEIEYGWLSEPAVVGQPNAIVINVTKSGEPYDIDLSKLLVQVEYGGQSKSLELQPLNEDGTGHYIGRLTPTQRGQYRLHISGSLGDQSVDATVQPEDVEGADAVEFPVVSEESTPLLDVSGWVAVVALVVGLVGIGLGTAARNRSK